MTLKYWAARQRATTIIDITAVDENRHRKRGPKGKRAPEIEALPYDALSQGVPIKIACQYAGINEDAHYDWARQDLQFAAGMARARAASVVHDLILIRAAASYDWRAAEAHARMVEPRQYGRNAGDVAVTVTTDILEKSPEFATVMRTIREALAPHPKARWAVSEALQRSA
jgi:hypothetical protein